MKVKAEREILEFCQRFATPLNVKVAEVEFKQGKNPTLTVFIKKDGGVDLDTCEAFHNAILEPIDEFDPTFGQPYTLNVSSLGIDWAFKTEEDFTSHLNTRVEVKLKNSIRGKKSYDGILVSFSSENIALKVDGKTTFTIEFSNIVKVNEYIDFN